MLFDSVFHCAMRLMCMCAVVEAALMHHGAHLGESLCECLLLHVEERELLNTGSINDITPKTKLIHLCKRGGMFTFFVHFGYLADSYVEIRVEAVHQSRLTDARVT